MKTWWRKSDFEILFKDSPECFGVENARMFQECALIRFVTFDGDKPKDDVFFPIENIHRIKRIQRAA